ncbi:MAG: hypothetical protein O2917_09550 [Acidobacteria bacterium]|nr:hypothetical protein [Acidobacteriota bacterium]
MSTDIPTPRAPRPEDDPARANPDDAHEGATDDQVSDRKGPGAGYGQEPEEVENGSGTVT